MGVQRRNTWHGAAETKFDLDYNIPSKGIHVLEAIPEAESHLAHPTVDNLDSRCIFYECATSDIGKYVHKRIESIQDFQLGKTIKTILDVNVRQNELISQLQSNNRYLELVNKSNQIKNTFKEDIKEIVNSSFKSSNEELTCMSTAMNEMNGLRRNLSRLSEESRSLMSKHESLNEVTQAILKTCEMFAVGSTSDIRNMRMRLSEDDGDSELSPTCKLLSPDIKLSANKTKAKSFGKKAMKKLKGFLASIVYPCVSSVSADVFSNKLNKDIEATKTLCQANKVHLSRIETLLEVVDSFGISFDRQYKSMEGTLNEKREHAQKEEKTLVIVVKLLNHIAKLNQEVQEHALVKSKLINELDECNLKLMASENKGCQVAIECLMLQ